MSLHNLADKVTEINRAAAENARIEAEAAPHLVAVAGSMGPTGQLMEPMGTLTFDDAKAAFREQAQGLSDGGVDVFWIETMSDLSEVKAAFDGARSVSDLPIAATMTFDTHGHTMMGISPEKAIQTLNSLDLIVVGANCGNGPQEIEEVVRVMHQIDPKAILVAKANAGLPKLVGTNIIYDGTPEVMAKYALQVRDLGATLIGACCGSTPSHISAMAEAINCPIPSNN
jgi:5-methyltetrahydrofolate--homocysteine methyltransferase